MSSSEHVKGWSSHLPDWGIGIGLFLCAPWVGELGKLQKHPDHDIHQGPAVLRKVLESIFHVMQLTPVQSPRDQHHIDHLLGVFGGLSYVFIHMSPFENDRHLLYTRAFHMIRISQPYHR